MPARKATEGNAKIFRYLAGAERSWGAKNLGQLMLSDRSDSRMHMVRRYNKFAKLMVYP
jgi:hypothetical protein